MYSRWTQENEVIFDARERGGRHYRHLSVKQGQGRVVPALFVERAQADGVLNVGEIRQAYERHAGRRVAASRACRYWTGTAGGG